MNTDCVLDSRRKTLTKWASTLGSRWYEGPVDGEPDADMNLISKEKPAPVVLIALLLVAGFLLAGCSSIGRTVDAAKYDKMSCPELNSALGENAREISQIAITRGKVANTSVPRWLLGGSRVKTAVANRETARIDQLKQRHDAIVAARARRCQRSAS
jgi:outer membrane murein-binding lipoprotein Lpp